MVMRISFLAVNAIQVLPAVTLGSVLIPHKNLLVTTTSKRKTGQGTEQEQTNNTLQVAFVCVLKIEKQGEKGGN